MAPPDPNSGMEPDGDSDDDSYTPATQPSGNAPIAKATKRGLNKHYGYIVGDELLAREQQERERKDPSEMRLPNRRTTRTPNRYGKDEPTTSRKAKSGTAIKGPKRKRAAPKPATVPRKSTTGRGGRPRRRTKSTPRPPAVPSQTETSDVEDSNRKEREERGGSSGADHEDAAGSGDHEWNGFADDSVISAPERFIVSVPEGIVQDFRNDSRPDKRLAITITVQHL